LPISGSYDPQCYGAAAQTAKVHTDQSALVCVSSYAITVAAPLPNHEVPESTFFVVFIIYSYPS
jgi:hypothetical protein